MSSASKPMPPPGRRGGWLPIDVPASQRPPSYRVWRAMTLALASSTTSPTSPRPLLVVLYGPARAEPWVWALRLADGTAIPLVHLGYDDERGFYDMRTLTE